METQSKTSAKDFFINLGAIVALYVAVINLINLLFRAINNAYPQINQNYYGFLGSESISWPVATLIVFSPIFILLMWLLERDYKVFPEKQYGGIHKWLAYITLFVFGLVLAGDLLAVLYYFIDGRELTLGFLLKVLALLIIAGGVFSYYLFDVHGKLTGKMRIIYRVFALALVSISIILGFVILGSPRTQQLIRRDEVKISLLQNVDSSIESYYANDGALPATLEQLMSSNFAPYIEGVSLDKITYTKTGDLTYKLCADFNRESKEARNDFIYPGNKTWQHPAGPYCFISNVSSNPIKIY